jgi:hypothetical protein
MWAFVVSNLIWAALFIITFSVRDNKPVSKMLGIGKSSRDEDQVFGEEFPEATDEQLNQEFENFKKRQALYDNKGVELNKEQTDKAIESEEVEVIG